MSPTFWLTIRVSKRRIPIPLFIIFPIVLVIEILALLPLAIYAIWKKQTLPLKVVSRFCLSRLMLILMIHGGAFRVSICDGDDRIHIGGHIRDRRHSYTRITLV